MKFLKSKQFIIGASLGFVLLLFLIILISINRTNNNSDDIYYNIVFDSDGGSKVSSQFILDGDSIDEPSKPLKEGYNFLGWYLDGKKYDFDNKIKKDIVLVARWEKIELNSETNEDVEEEGSTLEEETDDNKEEIKKEEDKKDDDKNQESKKDVTKVTLNNNSLSLNVGESSTLVATVSPSDATNKNVSWSSSNSNVVTVVNGKVVAVGVGSATVTATAGRKSVSCTVSVNKKQEEVPKEPVIIDVSNIVLSSNSLSLKVGESSSLIAVVSPSDATNKDVSWSSSNSNVATVVNGKVVAVGAGSATITATAGGKSVSCTVSVSKNVSYSIYKENVEGTAAKQVRVYIYSSEGNYVNGTIKITYITGATKDIDVTSSGYLIVESIFKDITIVNTY